MCGRLCYWCDIVNVCVPTEWRRGATTMPTILAHVRVKMSISYHLFDDVWMCYIWQMKCLLLMLCCKAGAAGIATVLLGTLTALAIALFALSSRAVSMLNSGTEGPGFKSQPRHCRVTVLGKLFLPTLCLCSPSSKTGSSPLNVARVTAGLAECNGYSLPSGLWFTPGWLPRTGISSGTLRSAVEYGLHLPFLTFMLTTVLAVLKCTCIIHHFVLFTHTIIARCTVCQCSGLLHKWQ